MSLLLDLSDERRAGKPGLPADDRDVTNGLVVRGPVEWDGRPNCVRHGAMNAIAPPAEDEHRIYRCYSCGVGAQWYPTNSKEAKIRFRKTWDETVRVA
jgi:hypothetical protein